jgi:hypothetical protein
MTDGRVPRLAALVREAAAVLAAILIAFALDAWWDERVEQRDMLEALDAVAIEIERNLVEIDTAFAYNLGRGELVAEAFELMRRGLAAVPDSELARFENLPNYYIVTLEMGAVTAFIQGGFLAILEDRDLRASIASIPRLDAELAEEAAVVTSASDRLNSSVLNEVPVQDLVLGAGSQTPSPRAILESFRSEETQRALGARTFFLNYLYGSELKATRTRLDEILNQIRAFQGE